MTSPVRVRLAPSPTGFMHVGNLRTALYNWFFARRHGGTFVVRIEDTDRERLVEGAVEQLAKTLFDLGLEPDEGVYFADGKVVYKGEHGPYVQSARKERHLAYAQQLIAGGKAYYCFCTKERLDRLAEEQKAMKQALMYDRACRALEPTEALQRVAAGEAHVIRLAVPSEGLITMHDLVHGEITIPWKQVDDQVLIKSDGFPTYHLAATCDDHDMEISHVIRGEEWISSLPKHLFLYEAFGWKAPEYAHLPLLLNADHSKLSKRQGDVAVEDFLKKGYLPEALVNFVSLLGWNPTSDREIFTKEELAELFEITKVNKSGAVFNTEKLDWMNAHYIKQMDEARYLKTCQSFVSFDLKEVGHRKASLLVRERLNKFSELAEAMQPIIEPVSDYAAAELCWKTQAPEEVRERLQGLTDWLQIKDAAWFDDLAKIESDARVFIVERGWGNGDTLWPLRVALSGTKQSPSPFELLWAYGKERSLERIALGLAKLK